MSVSVLCRRPQICSVCGRSAEKPGLVMYMSVDNRVQRYARIAIVRPALRYVVEIAKREISRIITRVSGPREPILGKSNIATVQEEGQNIAVSSSLKHILMDQQRSISSTCKEGPLVVDETYCIVETGSQASVKRAFETRARKCW